MISPLISSPLARGHRGASVVLRPRGPVGVATENQETWSQDSLRFAAPRVSLLDLVLSEPKKCLVDYL